MTREENIWKALIEEGIVDAGLPNYYKGQEWTVEFLLERAESEYKGSEMYLKRFDNKEYTGSDLDLGSNREINMKKVQGWFKRDYTRYLKILNIFEDNKEDTTMKNSKAKLDAQVAQAINEQKPVINELITGVAVLTGTRKTKVVKVPVSQTTVLYTFTGMNLGEKEIVKKTAKVITVRTKGGDLTFDAKTGVQTNCKNPKFANKIILEVK